LGLVTTFLVTMGSDRIPDGAQVIDDTASSARGAMPVMMPVVTTSGKSLPAFGLAWQLH